MSPGIDKLTLITLGPHVKSPTILSSYHLSDRPFLDQRPAVIPLAIHRPIVSTRDHGGFETVHPPCVDLQMESLPFHKIPPTPESGAEFTTYRPTPVTCPPVHR